MSITESSYLSINFAVVGLGVRSSCFLICLETSQSIKTYSSFHQHHKLPLAYRSQVPRNHCLAYCINNSKVSSFKVSILHQQDLQVSPFPLLSVLSQFYFIFFLSYIILFGFLFDNKKESLIVAHY